MSQQKVDKYKQEKANRKQIMKKEKRAHILRVCSASVVVIALAAWLSFSAYDKYQSSKPRNMAEVDYTEFMNYLDELS